MRPTVLPLAAVLLAFACGAAAERSDREKEIVIVADKWELDDANKVTTLNGNVVVTQGTMRITAAQLTMREDAKKNKFYVATGSPVTFRQKRDKAEEYVDGQAQRAEFDDSNDMLKLYERARVKSGDNQITSEFISYDMKRELAEASGAAPGKAPPADARVKVIILPPKKTPEGDDKKAGVELKSDPGKQ